MDPWHRHLSVATVAAGQEHAGPRSNPRQVSSSGAGCALGVVSSSGRIATRKNPQILRCKFEKAFTGASGWRSVAAQPELAQLEQILAPVPEKHVSDQFGPHAIVGGAV